MSALQKFLTGIIAIGLLTSAVLPKRQTPQVIGATFTGGSKLLGTAMGTAKPV
jgi:hypothetical protein